MNIKLTVPGLLGVLFVALKLTHQIDWSWWYVTRPFWLPSCFFLCIALIALIVALFVEDLK